MKQVKYLILLFLLAFLGSCSDNPFLESEEPYVDPLIVQGRNNAVQKAHLLTDIHFVPLNTFQGNGKIYQKDVEYSGMIYSSVKEIGSYVGSNVGIYTFLTAVNNPRSVLYTIDLSKEPYHGKNCHAYYGTVCSAFVSYALGIPGHSSYDFPVSDQFTQVRYSSPDDLELADVLWRSGHVALITGINRVGGFVSSVEVSQAVGEGCVRKEFSRDSFKDLFNSGFQAIFRYTGISENLAPVEDYLTTLQAVDAFKSSAICANKGDKYCYLEGEDVILNVFQDYKSIELFRDEELMETYEKGKSGDLHLENLPYGKYRASITLSDDSQGGITEWIVVDYTAEFDFSNNTLYFSSLNARPEKVRLTNREGGRKCPFTEVFSCSLTDEDILSGAVTIPVHLMNEECPYYSITFKTEFGRISLRPQPWKDEL